MQRRSWATGKRLYFFGKYDIKIHVPHVLHACTHGGSESWETGAKRSDFREAFLIAKLVPYGKALMMQRIMLHKFMAQKSCTLAQLVNTFFFASFQRLANQNSYHQRQYRMTSQLPRYLKWTAEVSMRPY